MKKLFSFIAILSLILTSCEGLDMGQTVKPENLFSDADLEKLDGFDAEGGTARITFTPDYDWEASANRAWIALSPESGVAGEEVRLKVTLEENTTDKEREGNIIVELSNGNTCKIAVRQLAGKAKEEPVVELVDGKTYDIEGNGGELQVKVRTNTEYEVVIASDAKEWLSVADTRAMREETLTFTAEKNDTGEERSAKVTLTYNDGEEIRFTIYQDVAPQEETPVVELVDGNVYNIEGNGGVLQVKVRTNTEYEVVIASDAKEWLSVADTRAMREETLTFTATKNDTGEERSAKVTLTYNDGEVIRFTIFQDVAPQIPDSKTTIADVLAGENGNYTVEGAWVVATYAQGCLLTDNSGAYILAFQPSVTPSVTAVVNISGEVTTYAGLKQFAKAEITVTGNTHEVNHRVPEFMGADQLDAYLSSPSVKYVEYEGVLAISGNYYNVNITDAQSAIGSIQYPDDDIKAQLTGLNGKLIKVKGYLIGVSSNKYTNTMAVEVTESQNEAPEIPVVSIADITKAGTYTVKGAWAVATYDRGSLLTDNSGAYILAFKPNTTIAEGAVVDITGNVTLYGGLLQFGQGAEVVNVGSTTVNHPNAEVMDGAALDAYLAAPTVKYVEYEGTLAIDGNYYNINIDDAATAIGAIQYPNADLAAQLTGLNGKKIKVKGYLIGVSQSKYTNTMAVEVTEVTEPVVPPTPVGPTIADVLAGENGDYTVEEAWVVAIYDRGCLLTDNSGAYILAYNPATTPAVGTIISISGSVTTYGGLKQFGAGAVVTETGSKSVTQPTPEVMDSAALDAYVSAPVVKFVSYEGTLAVSGNYYNVNLDGAATAIGSVQYPTADIKAQLNALNGKIIKVTGYLIGVSSGKYTNTMAVAVEEVGGSGGDDPVVPPTPVGPEGENIISSVANLTAGTYVMAGWSTSYTNSSNGTIFDWTNYPYHFWTGEVSALGSLTSNSDLKTVNGNAKFELDPNMSDQDKAKGYPASITLVAVDGKTDTYYVMVGDKYLYSSEASKNRRMQLGDTPTEWVASDNANGGIQLTSNGVNLGTAGAQYNMIRSYANAGTLKYGLVFFKTTGNSTEGFTQGNEQNPGWN